MGQTIEVVTAYNVVTITGRVLFESIDVFEAFRIARKLNAKTKTFVERIKPNGDTMYFNLIADAMGALN